MRGLAGGKRARPLRRRQPGVGHGRFRVLQALEVMRQPIEERLVTISRAKMSVDFPASFMLVASMNPCPCGYFNHPEKACTCPPGMVRRYMNKISGPLMDRIDLHVEVTPVPVTSLLEHTSGESSGEIRQRVIATREIQATRFAPHQGIYSNAQMNSKLLKLYCRLEKPAEELLRNAMQKLKLSARAYDRILKVSRTIADMSGCEKIQPVHIGEAIQFRSLDRENWWG